MKFNIAANAIFEASGIDNAFFQLSAHFHNLAIECVSGEKSEKAKDFIQEGLISIRQSDRLSFDTEHYVLGLTDAIYELDQERGLADMIFDDEKSQRIYKVAIANAICMILDKIVMTDENHPNSERVIKLQAKYMSGTD